MGREDYLGPEHRQYTRMDCVFPVQFKLVSLYGKSLISDWLQGFTNDISKGGIRLSINNLPSNLAAVLNNKQANLSLEISIPLGGEPVNALALKD